MEAEFIDKMLMHTCPKEVDKNTGNHLFYFDLHCMDLWVIAKKLYDVWSIVDYIIVEEGDKKQRDEMMYAHQMAFSPLKWAEKK